MRSDCPFSRPSDFESISRRDRWVGLAGVLAAAVACSADRPSLPDVPTLPVPGEPPDGPRTASLTHGLAPTRLDAGQESLDCYSWTLDNDKPLYVNAVDFANLGSYHHSNWFVVPDTVYSGPDGAWDCQERDFDALGAAQAGTVLFAQSTQAWEETMAFETGAVIRIPAHSRVVGDVHLLNLSPRPRDTQAWMTMHLIHPFDVAAVLSPIQLSYLALEIPAMSEIRFQSACEFGDVNMKIHYVLPHYHSTGVHFSVTTTDGQELVAQDGFDGSPQGRAFTPAVELPGIPRFEFSCGYRNWHSSPLTWGVGINEMCVVLMLAEAAAVHTGTVTTPGFVSETTDGVPTVFGSCAALSAEKGLAYEAPLRDELVDPLYVPTASVDVQPAPRPTCVDADDTVDPAVTPTLDNLREHVLEPWCSFSSCHGEAAAAGLDLQADDLHTVLLNHQVGAATELPLVTPGAPQDSWLYRVVAQCEPSEQAAHMPKNAPVLLEDDVVAIVREWIAAGAPE